MGIMISRGAFDSADQETKLLLIYDMLIEQNKLLTDHTQVQESTCSRRIGTCDTRILKLERRKMTDSGIAAAGGVLGGVIAVIMKIKLWP